jgi:hypothetical protein
MEKREREAMLKSMPREDRVRYLREEAACKKIEGILFLGFAALLTVAMVIGALL